MAVMTSSWPLAKNVPVDVLTVLSMLLPVSLSTTVDLVICGLACNMLAFGTDALSGVRFEGKFWGGEAADLLDHEIALLVGKEVLEDEGPGRPGHLDDFAPPQLLHNNKMRLD